MGQTKTAKSVHNMIGNNYQCQTYKFHVSDIACGPALVAEWVKPPAAVHAGQGSLPAWVEA